MQNKGDFLAGSSIPLEWFSYNSLGASALPSSLGTAIVYRSRLGSTTTTTVGVSENSISVNAIVGFNRVTIDSSASAAFYAPAAEFYVVGSGYSIDGQFVNVRIGSFAISNRYYGGLSMRSQAAGGAAQSFTFPAGSSASTDWYNGWVLQLMDGPGSPAAGMVVSYAGATKVATMDRTWPTAPTSATTFEGYSGSLPATADEAADSLLGRNVQGGSSSGRLVKEAFYVLRNKVDATGSVGTVYGIDDSTSGFTFSWTTGGFPLSKTDPAG
jgi:hypothetical protein